MKSNLLELNHLSLVLNEKKPRQTGTQSKTRPFQYLGELLVLELEDSHVHFFEGRDGTEAHRLELDLLAQRRAAASSAASSTATGRHRRVLRRPLRRHGRRCPTCNCQGVRPMRLLPGEYLFVWTHTRWLIKFIECQSFLFSSLSHFSSFSVLQSIPLAKKLFTGLKMKNKYRNKQLKWS